MDSSGTAVPKKVNNGKVAPKTLPFSIFTLPTLRFGGPFFSLQVIDLTCFVAIPTLKNQK
jgi:hypothetical protein